MIDSIGALIASICGWLYLKRKKDPLFNNYFDEWFESERIKNTKLEEKNNRDNTEKTKKIK